MKYFIIILMVFHLQTAFSINPCEKCDIEKVKIVNDHLDSLTRQMVSDFLCTFDTSCNYSVEYSEYSNETLFAIIEHNPTLFFQAIAAGIPNENAILNEIANPVNDKINLQSIYNNIKATSDNADQENRYLHAVIVATEKMDKR